MQICRPHIFNFTLKAIALWLAVGVCSCSKGTLGPDTPQGGVEGDVPLVFAPLVDWGVKSNALINSGTDLQSYSISLLANATRGNDISPVFRNHRMDYTSGAWGYGTTKYWISGAKYSFAAFAPFAPTSNSAAGTKNTISNGTINISGTDENPVLTVTGYNTGKVSTGSPQFDARSEDLLGAQYVRDNSSANDYSTVSLNFEHLLSCIDFKIRNATSTDITTVSNITLTGIKYKCDIEVNPSGAAIAQVYDDVISAGANEYFISGVRSASGGETSFLPKGMSETEYKPLFDCTDLTLLPQDLYGKTINLTFTVNYSGGGSNNYILRIGEIETIRSWAKGKKYSYKMTITSKDILFQVVEVPWIEHNIEL